MTAVSVVLALVVGSLGAYAIARFHLRFRLERKIGLSLLTLRIVPPVVILIPVYLLMLRSEPARYLARPHHHLHCSERHVLRLDDGELLPRDSGRPRGVGDGRRRFALHRLSPHHACRSPRPALSPTAIFAVIVTFNEFMFALVLTATPRAMTMPRGTATLIGRIDTDWASMSAAGVVGALPIVIFALLVQRHLVRGLTLGALK